MVALAHEDSALEVLLDEVTKHGPADGLVHVEDAVEDAFPVVDEGVGEVERVCGLLEESAEARLEKGEKDGEGGGVGVWAVVAQKVEEPGVEVCGLGVSLFLEPVDVLPELGDADVGEPGPLPRALVLFLVLVDVVGQDRPARRAHHRVVLRHPKACPLARPAHRLCIAPCTRHPQHFTLRVYEYICDECVRRWRVMGGGEVIVIVMMVVW